MTPPAFSGEKTEDSKLSLIVPVGDGNIAMRWAGNISSAQRPPKCRIVNISQTWYRKKFPEFVRELTTCTMQYYVININFCLCTNTPGGESVDLQPKGFQWVKLSDSCTRKKCMNWIAQTTPWTRILVFGNQTNQDLSLTMVGQTENCPKH